jgi:hypothetical protein
VTVPHACRAGRSRLRDRDAVADFVPEGNLDRRFLRGTGGTAQQGCRQIVGIGHPPPEGRLARRVRRVAEARSFNQTLRLHLVDHHLPCADQLAMTGALARAAIDDLMISVLFLLFPYT